MISGGFAGGGESSLARKAHLRSIRSGEVMEVQAVSKLPRLDTAITFSNSDLEGCQHPHDDPLVIRAVVANKTVHRVLVDNGSSADIIFTVGMVQGDQRVAREYYSTSMKQKTVDNIYLDELDMRDEVNTRPEPSKELEPVPLDDNPEHLAYIGSKLAENLRSLLTHFLRQNIDAFAWKQADMGGIDPTIITHRLNVSPSFKPVKNKRRSFAPERQKAINEEVGKLLQVGVIREVEYPEWLANVVLVKKANVKWRLCIDFTDVNRACPKYSFPFPRIDLIVDATADHELLSFMDSFSSYNQISMDPDDKKRPRSSQGKEPIVIV